MLQMNTTSKSYSAKSVNEVKRRFGNKKFYSIDCNSYSAGKIK